MCNPELSLPVRNVVVAGAGPSGLLLSALLLHRNRTQSDVRYRVTLIDAGQDYGKLDPKTELKKHRSWMIGLAGHGLDALRSIPKLYDEYVSEVGVRLTSGSLHIGAREFKQSVGTEEGSANEGYIVDRNYICAAVARYLNDEHGNGDDASFSTMYDTKILYVDGDGRRVLVRDADGSNERYVDYELLVGCDGIRSRVREAILQRHRDFECDVGDIFSTFKAVHVRCPTSVDPSSIHLLPSALPLMQGIALPEKGDMLNISFGVPRQNFDRLASEMKSDDPAIVAKYLKDNFKAFELDDYDDFARQWIDQRWNRTGQVHCSFYHSAPNQIVIMGDAAHATSPSIGMGMNTALRDAAEFVRLLDKHDDDVKSVLPAFSDARVKEGNSLTDLAMNLYCLDERAQFLEVLHMVIRSGLSKLFGPRLVAKHPQELIGQVGIDLSEVYAESVRQGIMTKHRRINDKIRRDHFEAESGMVKPVEKGFGGTKAIIAASALAVVAVAVGMTR
uniref:FAD-binding domain-containing protein n=1 Tax=Odontella aurita TaxID=265563 RepID=A0A6U6EID3_9STRA|mmetsp:Transcript_26974/g.79687  ORF Transcript_26974/g.79687 Transcript_26974/m.79687 type:complete len:504 (+) Transcript_26974:256-1767(+)